MNLSQVTQQVLINWLRGTTTAVPAGLRLALSTSPILMDGSGLNEPAGADGYARQVLSLSAGVFVNGTGTTTKNSAPIVFGPAVNNDWPAVTHAAILDTAGNVLARGALAAPRVVKVNDTYSVATDAAQLLLR